MYRLWELEAKVDPSLLAASIQNSVSIFGHCQAKPVEGEAMQAALLEKDAIVTEPTALVNHFVLAFHLNCWNIKPENTLGASS